MKVAVIGIGGIGTHLVRPLCRLLNELKDDMSVTLIDGDEFEPKNENRQEFTVFGNKAESLAEELGGRYPRLGIVGKGWYITEETAQFAINNGDIVFSCVDNHSTRKVISDRCGELQDVAVISGGNDYVDGNVQIYIRREGRDVTAPLTHLHPEISNPKDKNPAEMSCEELAKNGTPQIISTNFLASAFMLSTTWKLLEWYKNPTVPFDYDEIYFDAKTGNSRAVRRK